MFVHHCAQWMNVYLFLTLKDMLTLHGPVLKISRLQKLINIY